MEKKTLLAIVLSIMVLSGFYLLQGILYPPAQATAPNAMSPLETPPAEASQPVTAAPDLSSPLETPPPAELSPPPAEPAPPAVPDVPDNTIANNASSENTGSMGDQGPQLEERVVIETELLTVVLTNAGGDVVSWKLKEHKDKDDLVEMVLSGTKEAHAFTVAFGGPNAPPLTSLFYVNRISEHSVEFYRDFIIPNTNSRFRLTKRYDLKPKDYMFELTVTLDGGHSVPGFNFGGSAYTLSFGPQMGPRFVKLDNRYDYREYITYTNGKRKQEKVNESNPIIISSNPKWAAISGKYFSCIAIPLLAQYEINFSEKSEVGVSSTSRLNIIRPPLNSPRATDTYRFYLGPKSQDVLNAYNTGNNGFGSIEMQLTEVANTKGILSPLEKLLKWLLLMFYKLTPNYGVAIILLTLLVKILFFPLTKKGSEATLRMQAVAPKIKELQEKYKDNRQKMNTEMAELYKKEGYNPLSGCLPLLLQFPIFIAMYNLFNNHFDLRGAMFIPGWIPDLSLPESIGIFRQAFSCQYLAGMRCACCPLSMSVPSCSTAR